MVTACRVSTFGSLTHTWKLPIRVSVRLLNETSSVGIGAIIQECLHLGEAVAYQHAAGSAMSLAPSRNIDQNPDRRAEQRPRVRSLESVRIATYGFGFPASLANTSIR